MGYDGVDNWRSNGGVVGSSSQNIPEQRSEKFETAKYANSDGRYVVDITPLRSMAFECCAELQNAMANWPKFSSAHEGYAVLLEEVEELWDHVKTNQKRRDHEAMRKECIQIAAMAMRFALEICTEQGVKK